MSRFYFAYGSNMNPGRMQTRGLRVVSARSGRLDGLQLLFNKRATDAPHRSYANIAYAPEACVQGVLYELADTSEIHKMDPFEGAPWRYSRDVFNVMTDDTNAVPAWVYVANKAVLASGLKPARWYLEHLLAGRAYLTPDYYQRLAATPCLEDEDVDLHAGLLTKKGNSGVDRGQSESL